MEGLRPLFSFSGVKVDEHLKGRDQRLAVFAAEAVALEKKTSVPAEMAVGMWAAESRWGFKVTGDFNYWGITFNGKIHKARKWCATHEDLTQGEINTWPSADEKATMQVVGTLRGGRFRVSMYRWFASFESLEAAMAEYGRLLTRVPKYAEPLQRYVRFGDFDKLVREVSAHWAQSEAHAALVLQIAKQRNVRDAIQRARTAAKVVRA